MKSKRLSPFVPFRDFKGNALEAMAKALKDLRTFGVAAAKGL